MAMKEKAFAKINLFLNVVNKRFDGYHDLEMVMASVNLFDVLSFRKEETGAIAIECDVAVTDREEDNIVYRVATYLKEQFHVSQGVRIHIEKHIPIAAGLAGGSADAAAALRGLNRFWKLGLSLEQLAEIGLSFGSDVPFCVYNKLCIARGRGEELVFLDKRLQLPVLIVNPNIRVATKDVFAQVKQEHLVEHKIGDMTSGIYNHNLPLIARELHNSLEPIVFQMVPEVAKIKESMLQWGAEGALMSGSGATVFALASKKATLKRIAETLPDEYFKELTMLR
jgi:4-diphosphocytidyl-2-C-methyl-D-erythritol kinase